MTESIEFNLLPRVFTPPLYDDAVNSDDGDSYQYQASDLPTQFLGTSIRRLIISQGQRLPPLHTNTSTNNATENNSNEATTQTHTASNIRDDDAVIATDDHSSNNASAHGNTAEQSKESSMI